MNANAMRTQCERICEDDAPQHRPSNALQSSDSVSSGTTNGVVSPDLVTTPSTTKVQGERGSVEISLDALEMMTVESVRLERAHHRLRNAIEEKAEGAPAGHWFRRWAKEVLADG